MLGSFVKFMLEKLEEKGCTPPPGMIQCMECKDEVMGGFFPNGEKSKVGIFVVPWLLWCLFVVLVDNITPVVTVVWLIPCFYSC